jgi:hypothetical protein
MLARPLLHTDYHSATTPASVSSSTTDTGTSRFNHPLFLVLLSLFPSSCVVARAAIFISAETSFVVPRSIQLMGCPRDRARGGRREGDEERDGSRGMGRECEKR